MSYEFHGIRWMNDNELDPDSPERRGSGWAHAYVPVVGPDGEATGTAHVPLYMPRIYKELKRFALQVYRAAGGTTNNVELSGWWSSIKGAFKKMAKVVASNKALRAVAEKGLESAIPGGGSVSDGAKKVLEELVSKYRGGSSEAATQIKGFLEKANKGNEQDAKVVDALRREYVKQQSAGLPALMQTMASGDVVVFDPIIGARKKMSAKEAKALAAKRKAQAAQRKRQKQQPGQQQRRSPLRNSPQGPKAPGASVQQLRQAQRPAVSPYQQGMVPQQLQNFQQQPGAYAYPQGPYGYPSQGQAYDDGGSYYEEPEAVYEDPEQDAADEADLQAAAEENLARLQTPIEDDGGEESFEGAGAGADVSLTADEGAQWRRLSPEEQDRLKKMKPEELRTYLRTMAAKQKQAKGEQQRGRQQQQREQKRRADEQKKERERQGAQIRRDREQQAKRTQGRLEAEKRKKVEEAKRRGQAARRVNERRAEQQEYEERIAALEEQLERRDLADDKRSALHAQKAAYQDRLEQADKDLIKADLEQQRLAYAHREAMAKLRGAAAPAVYDEERGEEYDLDDPLVREALAVAQQAVEAEEQLEE